MEIYEKMKAELESLTEDMDKFYVKGNKSAGTRIRKSMQTMKALAQDLRVDVQSNK
jgi:hypothetical protein